MLGINIQKPVGIKYLETYWDEISLKTCWDEISRNKLDEISRKHVGMKYLENMLR